VNKIKKYYEIELCIFQRRYGAENEAIFKAYLAFVEIVYKIKSLVISILFCLLKKWSLLVKNSQQTPVE
jgi:hypothetical protein